MIVVTHHARLRYVERIMGKTHRAPFPAELAAAAFAISHALHEAGAPAADPRRLLVDCCFFQVVVYCGTALTVLPRDAAPGRDTVRYVRSLEVAEA